MNHSLCTTIHAIVFSILLCGCAASPPPAPPVDPIKVATDSFEAFAKSAMADAAMADAKRECESKDFRHISSDSEGLIRTEYITAVEINNDYTIDCKKSDSLLTPVVGEIKYRWRFMIKKATILEAKGIQFNRAETVKQMEAIMTGKISGWITVTEKCSFAEGKWKLDAGIAKQIES